MVTITRAALLGAISALTLAGCEPKEAAEKESVRPVRAITLDDTQDVERVWFTGKAAATQEVDLSFRVGGSMIERAVDIGGRVSLGDVVAKLDPATFEADLQRLQAQVAQAVAEQNRAASDLRRNQVLADRGHISRAALDKFIAAANVAVAAVEAQRAAVRRSELSLEYTQLEAPFTGEVVGTYAESFQEVQPNQPILRLVDTSRIEMTIDVPETMISLARNVRAVDVIFDPFPAITLSASIKEIGSEADQATRTFPVTLIMDQPDGATVLPGMAGRATPHDNPLPPEQRGVATIPETAIFTDTQGVESFVWVVDAPTMTVAARAIETGAVTRGGLTVMRGLSVGETVVTAGVNFLQEGQKVRILEN